MVGVFVFVAVWCTGLGGGGASDIAVEYIDVGAACSVGSVS